MCNSYLKNNTNQDSSIRECYFKQYQLNIDLLFCAYAWWCHACFVSVSHFFKLNLQKKYAPACSLDCRLQVKKSLAVVCKPQQRHCGREIRTSYQVWEVTSHQMMVCGSNAQEIMGHDIKTVCCFTVFFPPLSPFRCCRISSCASKRTRITFSCELNARTFKLTR